ANAMVCTLGRLSPAESASIIRQVANGKELPEQVFEQIQVKTDGIPLFIEELTKVVLESGELEERDQHWLLRGSNSPLSIPSSVQGSLMARLDKVGWAKELAQVLSVLGRVVSHVMAAAVCELPGRKLQDGLDLLV